jgi:hypothetical protein
MKINFRENQRRNKEWTIQRLCTHCTLRHISRKHTKKKHTYNTENYRQGRIRVLAVDEQNYFETFYLSQKTVQNLKYRILTLCIGNLTCNPFRP